MKVLASFIRGTPLEPVPRDSANSDSYQKVRLTIQEAITAIAQRNYRQDVIGETLDLSGSLFLRANLVKANFSGMNLREANFSHTNLEGVDFSGSNLERAIFYDSDLSSAILEDAKLNDAKYCSKTKFPANFDPDAVGMENQ